MSVGRPPPTRVLIAGGGVAALEAVLALRALAGSRVTVELLAPEPHFWYRPLAVAEPFGLGTTQRLQLSTVASAVGATFTLGSVVAIDAERRLAWTSAGTDIPYDALLLACGAVPEPAIPGALTFRGPADADRFRELLEELAAGVVRTVVFAQPRGATWALPLYELALMTAADLAARGIGGVELALATPDHRPLELFGPAGSDAVARLLEDAGISVHTTVFPVEAAGGRLRLVPDGSLPAERVVALPRLRGRRVDGVPQTIDGFVPVDAHGRVQGLSGVFAAGDVTTFPIKQGGIAAQQADAAAEAIAALAGVEHEPGPFRPVLRGTLLTGTRPQYLRRELGLGSAETSWAGPEPLWWPPAKIVGRYLEPFLVRLSGSTAGAPPGPAEGVPVESRLDEGTAVPARTRAAPPALSEVDEDTVAAVMSTDPDVVAPEDTLGEVAARLCPQAGGGALVSEYGRLIGVITSRDLLRSIAARVHPSEARVRSWMTADPVTVTADTPIGEAERLMHEYHVRRLPVVQGERPIGVVELFQLSRAAGRPTGVGLGF
jgi:sulfide:quinone oxidoreductase